MQRSSNDPSCFLADKSVEVQAVIPADLIRAITNKIPVKAGPASRPGSGLSITVALGAKSSW
jgi:hypothetical protein